MWLIALVWLVFLLFPTGVRAADFSQATLRLDSTKATSDLNGMVCAKPATTAVESQVRVEFPANFSLQSSGWGINTSNILQGSTSWPGIAYSSLSGQTVTFSSSDLTAGTLYCFNFTSSSQTGGTGQQTGSVSTFDSSNNKVDTKEYAVSIIPDNKITVSANIDPGPTGFTVRLEKITDGDTNAQGREMEFEIIYSSTTSVATKVIVQADWSRGTVEGDSSPTHTVLEYVNNSAGKAYNNAPPVVDLVKDEIKWEIPSLPGNTLNQKVRFKLRTTGNYKGDKKSEFFVRAKLIGNNFETPYSTLSKHYKYLPPPTLTPTITLTPTPSPLQFKAVDARSITSKGASIFISTSQPTRVVVRYGQNVNSLSEQIVDSVYKLQRTLVISGLSSNSSYAARVTAIDKSGNQLISDFYSFTTAGATTAAPVIDASSLLLTSSDVLLNFSESSEQIKNPTIILSSATQYSFRFKLSDNRPIKSVQVLLRNKKILGLTSNILEDTSSDETNALETQNNTFIGRLKTPDSPGDYDVIARIIDADGNVVEQKIADLRVTPDFKVVNASTKQPVENAQVYFYLYSKKSRLYTPLPPQVFPVKNPVYTNVDGTVDFPLPQGKYRARVTAIGYAQKNIQFTLGKSTNEIFPTVALVPQPFNLFTFTTYYYAILIDSASSTKSYVQGISNSIRFFDLNAMAAIVIFFLILIYSLSERIHVPLFSIPSYILHHAKILATKKSLREKIRGRVYDEAESKSIYGAVVFLVDSDKKKVVSSVITNTKGEFSFIKQNLKEYSFQIMKDGYEPVTYLESELKSVGLGGYLVSIKKRNSNPSIIEEGLVFIRKFASVLFETLLIISFLFELSLGLSFSFAKVTPFLTLSVLSLILWLIHLSHMRWSKTIS